ncbi:MAG: hypothetical protein M1829_000403 [Trizodia sp. TS-e1964]|nr:MAG: hypothetical protein M1829_000403 [Trizodia sp. TS-e1964]
MLPIISRWSWSVVGLLAIAYLPSIAHAYYLPLLNNPGLFLPSSEASTPKPGNLHIPAATKPTKKAKVNNHLPTACAPNNPCSGKIDVFQVGQEWAPMCGNKSSAKPQGHPSIAVSEQHARDMCGQEVLVKYDGLWAKGTVNGVCPDTQCGEHDIRVNGKILGRLAGYAPIVDGKSKFRDIEGKTVEWFPPNSTPHHLIFIADPQLIDPHTYPDRPWPLSSLTILQTDHYLSRVYNNLLYYLHPDTIFFLGDLFDGGREWSTETALNPDAQWRMYGEAFWLREYQRFGRIFFDPWRNSGMEPGEGQLGRKIIASLPGNHDLGIGTGIQIPVRDRFQAYFGEGNRIDVVGNHTFVSVDTVSLSAIGEPDPSTASQGFGLGDGPPSPMEKIWKPVKEFLDDAQASKQRAVRNCLNGMVGSGEAGKYLHEARNITEAIVETVERTKGDLLGFPTILLTHVPLYRPPGTPCGPQREHWPPSAPPKGQSKPLERDDRNAIAVRGGYQYQNVLKPEISKELVEKVGNVTYVFSGDDHDYCEILHKEFTSSEFSTVAGGIREITVKSISMAMGVRKPGFLMLSLWNPVDSTGNPLGTKESGHGGAAPADSSSTQSIQTHLCLQPDQLGILISYAYLIAITILTLFLRAISTNFFRGWPLPPRPDYTDTSTLSPLLPTSSDYYQSSPTSVSEKRANEHSSYHDPQPHTHSQQSSASSTTTANGPFSGIGLSIRPSTNRPRSSSPFSNGGYGMPLPPAQRHALGFESHFGVAAGKVAEKAGRPAAFDRRRSLLFTERLAQAVADTAWGVWRVACVALPWYALLLWFG